MTTLLRDVGEALYGSRWQTDLARDINVSDRQMRRWAAGQAILPPGVVSDLLGVCDRRIADLAAARERLRGSIRS